MSEIRTIAEIEAENEWLTKEAAKFKVDERYNYKEVDCDNIVDPAVAKNILAAVDKTKVGIECSSYTLVQDKYGSCIVGLNSEGQGLFTVDLPVEIPYAMHDKKMFEDTLEYYKEDIKRYDKISAISNLLSIFGIAAVVIIMAFLVVM